MSEETDNELFEISDFTNASPWETFVSSIEDVLQQWGLTASTYSADSGYWPQHRKSEKLSYVGHNFIVTLHVSGEKKRPTPKQSDQDWPDAMVHMMDTSNDFPPRAHHHISRWYGVDQFILICPDEKSQAIISEAQSKLLLSSVSLAISNTGCTLPIFIQIQKNWRHMYTGQCEGCGLRTTFEMIHLRHIPSRFNHLAGLIELFKSKLNGLTVAPPDMSVAARLTYCLRHWNVEDWPVGPLSPSSEGDAYLTLPVGATSDPIQELHLCAVWPHLTEETITDNATSSGFDPFTAPKWSIRTHLLDNPGLLLNERLTSFLKNCYRSDTFTNLLGNKLLREDIYNPAVGGSDFSHALTKLTSPSTLSTSLSLTSVVYSTSKKLEFGSEFEPITPSERDRILECLFPDCVPGSSLSGHGELTEDSLTRQLKSSPPNSLTMRLAKAFCNIQSDCGLKAMAHIWYEVIQELRYRWENGIPLPSLGKGHPEMQSCLLHQKLQMLNNCILHKISHAKRLHYTESNSESTEFKHSPSPEGGGEQSPTSSLSFSQRIQRQTSHDPKPHPQTPPSPTSNPKSTSSESEDEFFEAQETLDESHKKDLRATSTSSIDSRTRKLDLEPLVNIDPLSLFASENEDNELFMSGGGGGGGGGVPVRIGALEPFKDLTLLKTGERLYVPETQEQTPLTEDMLWEQQSVLSKLGTSEEAAHVRAKMQSMSLLSDMQAFKAANPGCVLEDFIRWYSPRDWIEGNEGDDDDMKDGWEVEENETKGHLSLRMRQPGNMWVETWNNAVPIPAYKQKRLFDDTKEAEKVLHWLSALKPSELVLMLLPCLVHAAVLHLQKKLEEMTLPSAWGYIDDAINITMTMQGVSLDSLPIYQECFGLLEKTEHDIATATSLRMKLKQGLDINRDTINRTTAEDKELMASIQILVEEPELVLQDPITSVTGLSFQGLLKTQMAFQSLEEISPLRHSRQPAKVAGTALPRATAREFILRTVSPQPSLLSTPAPQRMFCLLTKEETRIAGALTHDVLIA